MPTENLSSFAKLTAPKLPKVVERKRLFEALDQARQMPIVWITAPAGMGKTTLVASYLRARRLKPFWYQVDDGDGDPATLFHYLRLGGQKAAPRYHRSLPHLTPEYFPALPVFTHRFFEQLFRQVSPSALMVLDNYQELPQETPVQTLLPLVGAIIPKGMSMMVVSRESPPSGFEDLQAEGRLAVLDEKALRLTSDETEAILRLHSEKKTWTTGEVEALQQKTQGWVAGVVLHLEQVKGEPGEVATQEAQTPQVVFDYLAMEVFKNLSPETQIFLVADGLPTQHDSGDGGTSNRHDHSQGDIRRLIPATILYRATKRPRGLLPISSPLSGVFTGPPEGKREYWEPDSSPHAKCASFGKGGANRRGHASPSTGGGRWGPDAGDRHASPSPVNPGPDANPRRMVAGFAK